MNYKGSQEGYVSQFNSISILSWLYDLYNSNWIGKRRLYSSFWRENSF